MGYFKQQNVEIQEFVEKELKEKGRVSRDDVFAHFPFLDENKPGDQQVVSDIFVFVWESLLDEKES